MHSKLDKMQFSYINDKNSDECDIEKASKEEEENLQLINQNNQHDTSDMLTLEGLRRQYNSCSNCGVSWYDDHISLDCSECGGYAMCRPCPSCNGQCGSMWRRDVKASHVNKQAEWHGSCSLNFQWTSSNILESTSLSEDKNANFKNSYRCIHLTSKPKSFISEAHIL